MNTKEMESLFPDKVVREVVTRVKNSCEHDVEKYDTTYQLLDEDMKVIGGEYGAACFVSLANRVQGSKGVVKYMRYSPALSPKLSGRTVLRWVELCQELGLLPRAETPEEVLDTGTVVDLKSPTVTVGRLYMYLCLLRWLREARYLVENVLDLVDNAGRDFWAAVVYCHYCNAEDYGHSLIPFKGIYNVSPFSATVSRDLGLVLRLHEIANDPNGTDPRQAGEALLAEDGYFSWNWFTSVVKLPKSFVLKEREMLLTGEVFPIISASSYEQAEQLVNQLQKSDSYVKFEENPSSK